MSRGMLMDTGMVRPARAGDVNPFNPTVSANAVDAADIVTIAELLNGIVQYTAFSAGRVLTTDSAVNILASAQFTAMDVGDSVMFLVSITVAFAGTWAAGAGVTLAGRATTPASSSTWVLVTKTSSTTVTWNVL